jgi:hypothetical protein
MRCNQPIVAPSTKIVVSRWFAGLAALVLLAILACPNKGKAAEKPGQPVPIQTAADTFLADTGGSRLCNPAICAFDGIRTRCL